MLRHSHGGAWRDLYAFTLTPAEPVDFEVAHHFTSTHPGSPFVRTLVVHRCGPRGRHILRGRCYTQRGVGGETVREIGAGEFGPLLDESFGLRLGDDLLHELSVRFPDPA